VLNALAPLEQRCKMYELESMSSRSLLLRQCMGICYGVYLGKDEESKCIINTGCRQRAHRETKNIISHIITFHVEIFPFATVNIAQPLFFLLPLTQNNEPQPQPSNSN
jgi:hypothetical protein